MQRAIGQPAARDGAPARHSGLREAAAGTSVLRPRSGMLPSKHVRPMDASRRLRPTEFPTFFAKIEAQTHTLFP